MISINEFKFGEIVYFRSLAIMSIGVFIKRSRRYCNASRSMIEGACLMWRKRLYSM